jgi:arylsulfatase A-like enzyme
MDTVRADATSLHGYKRGTTPNLARWATRGVAFKRAIATAPWTLPSHASMFTGRWPWECDVDLDRALDRTFPTLAEFLRDHGYATAGFASNTAFCSVEYGLSRGFAHYEDYVVSPVEALRTSALGWLIAKRVGSLLDNLFLALGLEPRHPFEVETHRKDAAQINRDALSWIARQKDRPYFAFLNYMDAHDPYLLPPGPRTHFGVTPKTLRDYQILRDWFSLDKRTCRPDEIVLARDAYDDCIAYLDNHIGRLLDELESRGQLKNTLVIIAADHGEMFGEHSRDGVPLFNHRVSLYQPEIHVPLVIIAPGETVPGSVATKLASLRDVPATVVDLLGLAKTSPFPGTSLISKTKSATASSAERAEPAVLSEFSCRDELTTDRQVPGAAPSQMRAVFSGNLMYQRTGDRGEELYDLDRDPAEQHNLAGDASRRADEQRMRRMLDQLVTQNPRQSTK